MSKNTGGPAFPREDYQTNGFDGVSNGLGQEGMSLRAYIATKVYAQLALSEGTTWDGCAKASVIAADALIAALEAS